MYCPNCGNQTSADQKFCRGCGLGLEKIAQSLGEQSPARVDETLLARKERLEKLGVGLLSVFGLGLLAVIIYALAEKILSKGNVLEALTMLGVFVMIVCGLISVFLFARAKELGEQASKRQLPANTEQKINSATRELLPEGSFEPVPTVTERTTELLFVEKRDQK